MKLVKLLDFFGICAHSTTAAALSIIPVSFTALILSTEQDNANTVAMNNCKSCESAKANPEKKAKEEEVAGGDAAMTALEEDSGEEVVKVMEEEEEEESTVERGVSDLWSVINHIALVVSDVGKSLQFYTDVVGLKQILRPNFDR